jgi:hypothetical protein
LIYSLLQRQAVFLLGNTEQDCRTEAVILLGEGKWVEKRLMDITFS